MILYDNTGEEIWHTDHNEWNGNAGHRKDTHTLPLPAGDDYVKVYRLPGQFLLNMWAGWEALWHDRISILEKEQENG